MIHSYTQWHSVYSATQQEWPAGNADAMINIKSLCKALQVQAQVQIEIQVQLEAQVQVEVQVQVQAQVEVEA